MTEWGLSIDGFYRPRLPEIRTQLEARWKGRFGANRNTGNDTPDGHAIDFTSEVCALIFEGIEGVHNASFFETAEGIALDLWMAGRGFRRNDATYSTVELELAGTNGTVIQVGSLVRNESGADFATDEAVTISGGVATVTATAVETGPLAAEADTEWTIQTPVTGWTGVSNEEDAEVGRVRETDPDFKQRYLHAIQLGGVGLQLYKVKNVETVQRFENDTDVPDALYDATHWVEYLVVGGDEQAIINTIAQYKPPGGGTQGDTDGTETFTGTELTIRFSRGTQRNIWLTINITPDEGFVPASQWAALETSLRTEIVAWANENHAHGQNIAPDMIRAKLSTLLAGRYSTTILTGLTDPPATTGIFTIADRDYARFDTGRTEVNITPALEG